MQMAFCRSDAICTGESILKTGIFLVSFATACVVL
jgi:hypothetical protein